MVAVITINYNLHKDTIACVKSILESDYPDFIIYLIDNGSEHEDYQVLLKKFKGNSKVRILRMEKNKGYVGGVNHGLENAFKEKPGYYMVMNNDTIIDKYAITELVNTAKKHNDNAIVSGKVFYYDHPNVLQHIGVIITDPRYRKTYYPGKNEKDVGQHDQEAERDSLDDVFWIIPAKIFKDVGYYCNYYFLYAEQGDYAHNARKKGYKLIYTPKAKMWHKESMTAGGGDPRALPIYYWRGKSSFISSYRNLKTKYFIIKNVKDVSKFIIKALVAKTQHRKANIARIRGYWAGFKWLFNKKPDNGYNPYIKK